MNLTDEAFSALISRAMDELPERDIKNLDNEVITYEDEPSPAQRQKLKLRGDQTLLGLYEGIPPIRRGAGYNLVLPDKITLFKLPILGSVQRRTDYGDQFNNTSAADFDAKLFEQIKHTLWHEIAHFYGLNHTDIHRKEGNS